MAVVAPIITVLPGASWWKDADKLEELISYEERLHIVNKLAKPGADSSQIIDRKLDLNEHEQVALMCRYGADCIGASLLRLIKEAGFRADRERTLALLQDSESLDQIYLRSDRDEEDLASINAELCVFAQRYRCSSNGEILRAIDAQASSL